MATRRPWSILVGEMVVGAYTKKRHSFICCLRRRRCAVQELGFGWLLLSLSPSITPEATLPSSLPDFPPESVLREGGDG
jgi:hypothetical protein